MAADKTTRATGTRPKYLRIADDLRERIDAGEFADKGYLPKKKDLEKHYGVALTTMSQALKELILEGLLESQQGVGTKILERPDPVATPDYASLVQALTELTGKVDAMSERLADVERKTSGESS